MLLMVNPAAFKYCCRQLTSLPCDPMINKDEYLFVVDERNKPVEAKPREEVHRNEHWHRNSNVWIRNFKGQILNGLLSEGYVFGAQALVALDNLKSNGVAHL